MKLKHVFPLLLTGVCTLVNAQVVLPANPALSAPSGTFNSQPQPVGMRKPEGANPPAVQPRAPAETQPRVPPLPDPDTRIGRSSEVFGAQLFTGAFALQGPTQFNPDYLLTVGDKIQLRMWGAFDFDQVLTVDPKGNIFIPNAGPVSMLGVRNQDLQSRVETAVARTYRNNVNSYASLAAAQPVRVYVGGNVVRPGLYAGTSMDSLLNYLDQAGGIDPERGSFLQVQVQRGQQLRASVNLYDFLLKGSMPLVQLSDGDVIFVAARQNTVKVNGLADNAKRFEFERARAISVADLMLMAKPKAEATHVRVVRNTGTVRNSEYYPLQDAAQVSVLNGDEVEFTADKKPGTITVRVEGEHNSAQEYVLPYGSKLQTLLDRIQPTQDADLASLQLFRQSVKQRQKDLLATSLRSLESALLTARSGSSDEARLRKDEADLTLQWVERAKQIEPLGQVQIAGNAAKGDMLLENGDVLRIPRKDALVLVSGEVLFPNAVAWQANLRLMDYIQRTGGYTQTADNARVVIARRDGSFVQANVDDLSRSDLHVNPGDQILVLPKVDEKNRQFALDITRILSQIAITARVVFGI